MGCKSFFFCSYHQLFMLWGIKLWVVDLLSLLLLLCILSFFNEYPLAIFPTLIVSGKQTIHIIDMFFHTKVVEIHQKYTSTNETFYEYFFFIYSLLYPINPTMSRHHSPFRCLPFYFSENFLFSA